MEIMMQTLFRRIQDQQLDQSGCLVGQQRVDIMLNYDEKLTPNPYDSVSVSKLVCFHNKYKLGTSKHQFFQPEELAEYFEKQGDNIVVQPVYLLHEQEVKLSTQPYDIIHQEISCLIGFAYITKEDAAKADLKWDTDEIKSLIELELELYEVWLNQSSYMYRKYDWSESANWKMIEENFNYQTTDFQGNGLFKAAGLL